MKLRRIAYGVLATIGALLLALVLYLAFGDLARYKPSLESLASEAIGRPFAIDGAFELKVLPSIAVVAERVRVGNAPWGAAPQMVEVGRFSTEIRLWSLLFGPVDVRSLELRDVSVSL
ncbi:MAG TPA: AsmA family protein, partial [Burkholderiales bacterium]|nr:AsmA family protein [Burkholderiales bacterium]